MYIIWKISIYSLITSAWTHGFLFHSVCYNLLSSSFILVLSWSGHWRPLQADFWGLFDTFHHVLSTFLAFWYNTMFQAYFVLPLPRINHLFCQWVLEESGIQKLKILLLENCCSSSCSSGRTRECIYLSTHTYKIYSYFCIWHVFSENTKSTPALPIPILQVSF